MTRARTGFLGDFAAGFLAGLFFGVAFFAAGFRTAGFLAAAFLAAGFFAAGFRLAAAMADVSPVPSEGARPSIRGPRRLRTTRRPGALARAHAPGTVPRASLPPHRARHGPVVRRLSATAISPTTRRRVAVDAPRKGSVVAKAVSA